MSGEKRKIPDWMRKNNSKKTDDLKEEPTKKLPKTSSFSWKPVEYGGKIEYMFQYDEIEEAFTEINKNIFKRVANPDEKIPVAFDLEWNFNFLTQKKYKTAVMQICIDLDKCYVLQVFKFNNLPQSLLDFLFNEKILLHGLNISMDIEKLNEDFPETKAGLLLSKCIDLRDYYNQVFNNNTFWSLASLCGQTLNLQMSKKLRISNWQSTLSHDQKLYAAIDVYIGQRIYYHIRDKQRSNEKIYDEKFGKKSDHMLAQRSDERVQKCDSEVFTYKFDNLKDLKMIDYKGKIHYLIDFITVAETFDRLNSEINKMAESLETNEKIPVAFDMEWSFDYKSGAGKTAVIQICYDVKECYVVHMSKVQRVPAALTIFLKNEHIVLHGVNIKNDFRKLERDFPCIKADPLIEKCVDLRTYYNDVFNSSEKWSLQTLCAHTLKANMDKSRNVRMSKWDYSKLSQKQLLYASIDVYVGQLIYLFINSKEKENSNKYTGFFTVYEELEKSAMSNNLNDDINALMNS
ncbi:hypothetical protein PVAND_010557 [Polypedilum vanderplanki]|uniref:3'-5' exonuclease n=1 Tax=Polypedilum vanderplanki TaxID=319348 RepID=A0A9J6CH38_POLVA|nr:hypothetical protein PVAND_010557 [Polypedilum vanderplanki]